MKPEIPEIPPEMRTALIVFAVVEALNRSITPSESHVMSCNVPRRVGCSRSR